LEFQETDFLTRNNNTAYNQYLYLQSQLYDALQPTVVRTRELLEDENISSRIIITQLQSDKTKVRYFYDTLDARYQDARSIKLSDILEE
jgi:hypothetical protein